MTKASYKENELFMSFNDYPSLRAHFGPEVVNNITFDETVYPMYGPSLERHEFARGLYDQMISEGLEELETLKEEIGMNEITLIDEPSDLGLFVIRNKFNEYLWVGTSGEQGWVDYDQASWLDESDAEWYNEGQWEIVEAV